MLHNAEALRNLQVMFEFLVQNPTPAAEAEFIAALERYRQTHLVAQQEALDEAKKQSAEAV